MALVKDVSVGASLTLITLRGLDCFVLFAFLTVSDDFFFGIIWSVPDSNSWAKNKNWMIKQIIIK